jgi:hypothetical protein
MVIALLLVTNRFTLGVKPQCTTDTRLPAPHFIFIAACSPLLENALLLQHASEYTHDRLKFAVPAGIIIAIGFSRCYRKAQVAISVLLILAAVHGWQSYKTDLDKYRYWSVVDVSNKKLAAVLNEQYANDCTVYLSNIGVRGYANLLFHHGIFEWKVADDAKKLMRDTHSCRSIFLEASIFLPGLPSYSKATVTDIDGTVSVVSATDLK